MAEWQQRDFLADTESHSPEALCAFLNENAPRPVEVTFTRNRVTMISVDLGQPGAVRLRLHEQFAAAPEAIRKALRLYLRTHRRSAWRIVSAYARDIEPGEDSGARRPSRLRTDGAVYDLKALYEDVNETFFQGRVRCRIGWGRRPARRRKRARSKSIRYGSWSPSTRTIRIHPALDDVQVPREFVRYIVFHEMLHAVVPDERTASRSYNHSTAFRRLERMYPDWTRMHRLADELLDVLV